MYKIRLWRVMVVLALLTATPLLMGCSAQVLYTEHPQVLVEPRGAAYIQLPDDDPRYAQLADYVAADLALARLLQSYESTTAAFAAADLRSPARVAVQNHAVIVLGAETGLLRDIAVQGVYDEVRIEVALGAPVADPSELATVAPELARAIGEGLMILVGQKGGAGGQESALIAGLGAALQAHYLAEIGEPCAVADGLAMALDPHDDAALASVLMQDLLAAPTPGYPQRYMLWFANYEPQVEALAKIVLVANRLPARATLADFVSAYAATFPSERERVVQWAAQLGASE